MAQQTAIQWLESQLETAMGVYFPTNLYKPAYELFEKAKAMEKEQIEKGVDKANENWANKVLRPLMTGEDYYNETYKH